MDQRGIRTMVFPRRLVAKGLGALLVAVPIRGALAAQYPEHMVTVIVPRAPGGGSDILMRLLAPALMKQTKQTFLIENHADPSTIVGTRLVADARAGGYTILATDNAFYENPAILPNLPYNTLKDFSAVTMLAQAPVVLLVKPSLPVRDVADLVGYAKANPGKVSFGSGGIGSSTDMAGTLFNFAAGTDIIDVRYASSGQALDDLLGGHITMQFGGISSSYAQINAGSLRALAVTGSARDPALPNVPTFGEQGLKGVDVMSVWGIHAPAHVPLPIRQRLRDLLVAAMATPEVKSRMSALGYHPVGNTPAQQELLTQQLVGKWLALGKKVDLRV